MTILTSLFITLVNLNKFHYLISFSFKFHNYAHNIIFISNIVLLSLPILYILLGIVGIVTSSLVMESHIKNKSCAKVPMYTDRGELIYVSLYGN